MKERVETEIGDKRLLVLFWKYEELEWYKV